MKINNLHIGGGKKGNFTPKRILIFTFLLAFVSANILLASAQVGVGAKSVYTHTDTLSKKCDTIRTLPIVHEPQDTLIGD